MYWNLRRVRSTKDERHFHIREVYYDEEHRPWGHSEARLRDIIRLWKDWARTPRIIYPDDFAGQEPGREPLSSIDALKRL